MRVEPPPPTGNYSAGGSSMTPAMTAALFAQLSALAPTSASGAQPTTPSQMTPQQINTYWLFRAMSDFAMLALTENPNALPSPNAAVPYLADLKLIQQLGTGLDPTFMAMIQNYNTGTNYQNIYTNFSTINATFAQSMTIPSGQSPYTFSSMTDEEAFYYCSYQMAFALNTGQELNQFWQAPNGKTSMGASGMGEFICTYLYQRNLGANGVENYTQLQSDLNSFLIPLQPMINYYSIKTDPKTGENLFREDFPDIYNMLNGGTDLNNQQYAGLTADIAALQGSAPPWPFSSNPAPTLPLPTDSTPAPPWDAPHSGVTYSFDYYTGMQDPGCNVLDAMAEFIRDILE